MSTALENAYQNALACRPSDSKRIERAYHLALDPRTKVLDGCIDIPSASQGFIIIQWERDGVEKYHVGACECADYTKHDSHYFCKHRYAVALILRASDIENPRPLPPLATLWECEPEDTVYVHYTDPDELSPREGDDALTDSETRRLEIRQAMYGEA